MNVMSSLWLYYFPTESQNLSIDSMNLLYCELIVHILFFIGTLVFFLSVYDIILWNFIDPLSFSFFENIFSKSAPLLIIVFFTICSIIFLRSEKSNISFIYKFPDVVLVSHRWIANCTKWIFSSDVCICFSKDFNQSEIYFCLWYEIDCQLNIPLYG